MKKSKRTYLTSKYVLEKAVSKSKEGSDVTGERSWTNTITFENSKLKNVKSTFVSSVALRLVKNQKIGISAGFNLEKDALDKVVADALEISHFSKKARFVLPFPGQKVKKPKIYDPNIEKISDASLIERGNNVLSLIKNVDPTLVVNKMIFSKSIGEGVFLNSNKVEDSATYSSLSFTIETSKLKKGDLLQIYAWQESVKDDIDLDVLVSKLLLYIKKSKEIVKVKNGSYKVIFVPERVSDLVSYLMTALNGRYVNDNSSKLASKIGQKIFDSRLSVIDDPTLDYYPESYSLDDEGVPGKRKILIGKGVVNDFFYDLEEANKAGKKVSGNGSRGLFSQASPDSSNVLISPGDVPFNKLIKDVDEGILVVDTLGVGQNDPFNGDFQINIALGFKVHRGEIVGRIKDASFSGNVFELLKNNIVWLSSDCERRGAFESPYLCIDKVKVISK